MTLDGNVGVRVVRTDYTASGSAKQPDWTSHPLLNNNGDPDFVAKYGSGDWLPNHFEDSYQDVLPSLNLRLKLTDESAAAIRGFQGDRAAEPRSAHGERLVGRRHPRPPVAGSEDPNAPQCRLPRW